MDNMPKVSVIIPVYNVENYLEECLDSVIGQTLKDIEIICVDDGSTDSSLNILQEYEKNDSRVIVLTQENKGAGAARNMAMSSAKGKYIAFMDADDYYPNLSVLQTMVRTTESNNVRICGGGVCVDSAGTIIPGIKRSPTAHFKNQGIISYVEVQYDYGYQRYIFEREMLSENNIFFPDYLRFQDPPFFVKAMLAAGQFYALDQDVYCYRQGHQRIAWTNRQVNDLTSGLRDVFELAYQNNLDLLAEKCIWRINVEYKDTLYAALKKGGNQKLFYKLMRFNVRINDLRHQEDLLTPIDMVLNRPYEPIKDSVDGKLKDENRILKEEIRNIHQSTTYRIGRFITWLPRKIRGGIRCYQEHGFRYTLQRLREQLLGR